MAWPFREGPNVAVISCDRIFTREAWIHYVTHDIEDGAWQFHPNDRMTTEEDAVVVALGEVVELDPSVGTLADLPRGWHAWRDGPDDEWVRAKQEDDE